MCNFHAGNIALRMTNGSDSNGGSGDDNQSEKKDKYSREAGDDQLSDSLRSAICKKKPNILWCEVAGLDTAKHELQLAAEIPNRFPKLFTGERQARRSILLYGPPGTGKGHLVKALATSVDSTLMVLSSSDVQSKWYGESERWVLSKTTLCSCSKTC